MKIRYGFVSNSSSSSFTIKRKDLTEIQVEQIIEHVDVVRYWGEKNGSRFGWSDDPWHIDATAVTISGYTTMDNFDMQEFLEEIGVSDDIIKWDW